MAVKKKAAPVKKKAAAPKKARGAAEPNAVRVYTLDVFILDGRMSEKFIRKNSVVSRTIQIRGDQTLEDLHNAIFDAFDRFDEHMYEYQFGKGPMDPKAIRYVLPAAYEADFGEDSLPAGMVDRTTIDSLKLKVGRSFGYWFDFGDDWWHQIDVEAIDELTGKGKFPRVTKRVGKSPPQYPEE